MKSLAAELNQKFRDLILEVSGLSFWGKKQSELDEKVLNAFAKSRFTNLEDYYQFLKTNPQNSSEISQLISFLTVGETYFFRNKAQFEALKQSILPEIIANKNETSRQIRIWCAGCATGEEPYSVAIVLRELLPDITGWKILIVATDINEDYLERARAGLYSEWSFREAPPEFKQKYFTQRGNKYKICREIRQMVTFYPLNLVQDGYPSPANNTVAMDIILCRNVTIYFRQDKIRQVVEKFYQALSNNGWLIVGHSEPSLETYKNFQTLTLPGTVVYKKVIQPRPITLNASHTPLFTIHGEKAPLKPEPVPAKPIESHKVDSRQTGFYQRGLELFKAGNLKQALSSFQQEIVQNPDSMDAYYMMAKIHADRGQLDAAIEHCKSCLKINKLAPRIYYLLSLILIQKGQYEEAKNLLKKLLFLDQEFVMGYLVLAQIYCRQGKKSLAKRCLDNSRNILLSMPGDQPISEAEGHTAGSLLKNLEDFGLAA